MICLSATNHTLEVTTSAAVAIDVVVAFVEHSDTGGKFDTQRSKISTATTTTVLDAPPALKSRQVKLVNIMNTSGTACTVTLKDDLGGVECVFAQVVVGPGERLQYADGLGLSSFTNSGGVKSSINQGSATITNAMSAAVLASDVVNNNATANTIASVTGLSFPVLAGKTYYFRFMIQYSAAATTTGSRWSITGPTTTRLNYQSEYSLTATTTTSGRQFTTYDLPAGSNATSATTAGNMADISGMITPSADGDVIARFASEVSNSAITALAGSVVYYQQLN